MVILKYRRKINVFLVILVGLMLSACTIANNESVVTTPFENTVEEGRESNQVPLEDEQASEVYVSTPTVVIADEIVEQEEVLTEPDANLVEPPALKKGLQATDPSTVNLASGEIQFVELFAFW